MYTGLTITENKNAVTKPDQNEGETGNLTDVTLLLLILVFYKSRKHL